MFGNLAEIIGLYGDLDACADLVPEVTGIAAQSDLIPKLQASAGIMLSGTVIYRPYFEAARVYKRQRHTRKLLSGEGAAFDKPEETIQGFLEEQLAIDSALQLIIPPGMSAETSVFMLPFNSVSVRTVPGY